VREREEDKKETIEFSHIHPIGVDELCSSLYEILISQRDRLIVGLIVDEI
jgi:hypothetical protein